MIPNFPNGLKPPNQSKTVFINPQKIPTTHINPSFLLRVPQPSSSSIYINPAFLPAHNEERSTSINNNKNISETNEEHLHNPKNRLIIKSRTKLIRESFQQHPNDGNETIRPKLIKIGSKKLVSRRSTVKYTLMSTSTSMSTSTKDDTLNKYKLDRRIEKNSIFKTKMDNFPTNKTKINYKNMKFNFHKNNIVNYKSLKTKYERMPAKPSSYKKCNYVMFSSKPKERIVCVRGNKFILDKQGVSLKRVQSDNNPKNFQLKRIDIGGVTYVENNNSNLLIRTESHWARNHLNVAKNRSISFLSNLQTKTDLPCLIYQKLGKCSAFEMGRCNKVHDKNRITICKRFLRGECVADKTCSLSHNVSMEKMPTCKFFLQGLCVREDCPYLHKKLNKKVDICLNFLNGFCEEAEKCTKRHEFACPNQKNKGEKCQCLVCIFCRPKTALNLNKTTKISETDIGQESKSPSNRYFFENDVLMSDSSKENPESQKEKRRKTPIGDSPSYIPF